MSPNLSVNAGAPPVGLRPRLAAGYLLSLGVKACDMRFEPLRSYDSLDADTG